jgi:hypothetical protein
LQTVNVVIEVSEEVEVVTVVEVVELDVAVRVFVVV